MFNRKTMKELASNSVDKDLQIEIEKEYNSIKKGIEDRAANGYFNYFKILFDNEKNNIILKKLFYKFKIDGFKVKFNSHGWTYLKLEVIWK